MVDTGEKFQKQYSFGNTIDVRTSTKTHNWIQHNEPNKKKPPGFVAYCNNHRTLWRCANQFPMSLAVDV